MVEWEVVEWRVAQFKEDMMDIDTIRYFGAAYIMESNLAPKEKCDMIDYVKEAEWDQILNLVFNGTKPTRKLTINEQYILEAQAENFIYPLIFKYMSEGKRKGRKKPTRQEKQAASAVKAKFGAGTATASEVKTAPVPPKSKPKTKTTPNPPKVKTRTPKEDLLAGYGKGKEYGKELYVKSKTGVIKHAPAVKRYLKGGSVVVLIAAATAAGHRVYKIYLSKAARQCKGFSGPERRSCIVRFKKAGLQAKMNAYVKAKNDCAGSKDPERCRSQLDIKIKKVRYKAGTLYSRL